MPEVSFEQVSKRFDPKNPHTEHILRMLRTDSDRMRPDGNPLMILGIKDKDLPELVYRIIQKGRYPVVDKKLRLVLGLTYGEHNFLIAWLEAYHRSSGGDHTAIEECKAYQSYLDKGRGYYISSMDARKIMVGIKYKQDRLDKDLFVQKKLEHEY